MEEICKLLSARIREAGKGGYTIFYEDDLLDEIPEDMRNRDTLEAALKKLHTEGNIDVKYARGNAFCIAFRKPYEVAVAAEVKEEPEAAPAPSTSKAGIKQCIALFLSAFAGGALSGCICAIIGAVI